MDEDAPPARLGTGAARAQVDVALSRRPHLERLPASQALDDRARDPGVIRGAAFRARANVGDAPEAIAADETCRGRQWISTLLRHQTSPLPSCGHASDGRGRPVRSAPSVMRIIRCNARPTRRCGQPLAGARSSALFRRYVAMSAPSATPRFRGGCCRWRGRCAPGVRTARRGRLRCRRCASSARAGRGAPLRTGGRRAFLLCGCRARRRSRCLLSSG